MSDLERAIELAEKWASPVPWRVMAEHLAKFQTLRKAANDWYASRNRALERMKTRDGERAELEQTVRKCETLAEEDHQRAETQHKCYLNLRRDIDELHAVLVKVDGNLLGRVPVAELVPMPSDETTLAWAERIKGLLGALLAMRSAPKNEEWSPFLDWPSWKSILKVHKETFRRRRNDGTYAVHPNSKRSSWSIRLSDLTPEQRKKCSE